MNKDKLSWSMANVVRLHRSAVNNEVSEDGVFLGQHRAMAYIASHPECSQGELAKALRMTPAAASICVKRLVELGLVSRNNDRESLRVKRLSITEKGKEDGQKIRKAIEKYSGIMFDGFSEDELKQLESYIERISENLNGFGTELRYPFGEEENKEND